MSCLTEHKHNKLGNVHSVKILGHLPCYWLQIFNSWMFFINCIKQMGNIMLCIQDLMKGTSTAPSLMKSDMVWQICGRAFDMQFDQNESKSSLVMWWNNINTTCNYLTKLRTYKKKHKIHLLFYTTFVWNIFNAIYSLVNYIQDACNNPCTSLCKVLKRCQFLIKTRMH